MQNRRPVAMASLIQLEQSEKMRMVRSLGAMQDY